MQINKIFKLYNFLFITFLFLKTVIELLKIKKYVFKFTNIVAKTIMAEFNVNK